LTDAYIVKYQYIDSRPAFEVTRLTGTMYQLSEHAAHAQREWAGEVARSRIARFAAGVSACCEASASFVARFARTVRQASATQPCTSTC
jgi:hypothetical protein